MPPTIPTQDALRERELAVIQGAQTDAERFERIRLDRLERWQAFLAELEVPPALQAWADQMEARYGPKVRVWRNTVGWIMALLVARYGEAEYNWPAEFTEDDLSRARAWLYKGKTPNGVEYIVAEEN
jgi:hypothetical protein